MPILQPGLVAKAAAPLPTAAAASLQGLRHSTLVLNGQEQGPAPQPVLPDGALPGRPLPGEEARIPAVIRNAHSSGSSSSAADVASVPVHAASWGDEGLPIYVAFYNVTPIIQNIVRNAAQYNFSEADAPCLRDADDGNATTAGTSARRSSGLGWGLGSTDKVECW